MRTNTIWKSLLMSAAMLVSGAMTSCEKEEVTDFDAQISSSLGSSPTVNVAVEADGDYDFTVKSNTQWTATVEDAKNILTLSKTSGNAGETEVTATISATAADGDKATVTLQAMGYAFGYEIPVTQKLVFTVGGEPEVVLGSGTADDPFTVAGAIAKCIELGADVESTDSYYIKGKIKKLHDTESNNFGNSFGNGSFYMCDEGIDNEFQAYRIYYLGNQKWQTGDAIPAVGDEVVVYGKIVYYGGRTPETLQGSAYLYSLNGSTGGDNSGEEPGETPGSDDENIITKAADVKAGTYYLAGYSESYNSTTYAPYSWHLWTGGIAESSGNCDMMTVNYQYNKEEKSLALNPNLSEQDAAKGVGVKVEIESAGKDNTWYIKYNGQYLYSKETDVNRRMALGTSPEEWVFSDHAKGGLNITNNGVTLGTAGATYNLLRSYGGAAGSLTYGVALFLDTVSLDGEPSGGEDPNDPEEPTDVKQVSVKEFNEAEVSKTQVYELTGVVENVIIDKNSFDLSDGTATTYIYQLNTDKARNYGDKGDSNLTQLGIQAGDKITIRGYRDDYNGTIEFNYGWLVEIVEKGSGEDPGDEPDNSVEVKAGTYYVFGYLTEGNNGQNGTIDFSKYPYHAWTGEVNSGDLVTTNYSYNETTKTFTVNPDATGKAAAEVEIENATGKEKVYYIKVDGKYLYATDYANNRKLALGDTPAEWSFENHADAGYYAVGTNGTNTIYLGVANAASKIFRSYKASSKSSVVSGLQFFAKEDVTFDDAGDDNPGTEPEEPEDPTDPEGTTIADILKAGKGTYTVKGAWVAQNTTASFIVTDNSGSNLYVYLGTGKGSDYKIGEVVDLSGDVSEYNGSLQFGNTTTITKTGETKSVTLPTPREVTGAEFDALKGSTFEHIKVTGKYEKDGSYTNLIVDGATYKGSLLYALDDYDGVNPADCIGKTITVTAFTTAVTTGNKIVQMVTTSIKVEDDNQGGGTTTPDPVEPEPTPDGAKTVTFDYTAQGYDNAAEIGTLESNGIKVEFAKGTNSNAAKWYGSGSAVRVYAGNTITISGATITKIEVTHGNPANDGGNVFYVAEGNAGAYDSDTAVWTGSATSVTLTASGKNADITGASGNVRLAKLVVTYTE